MVAYYAGDVPAEAILVEPLRGGEPINLDLFTAATVEFRSSAGTVIPSPGLVGTIVVDEVRIAWPAASLFAAAGLYSLRVTLTGTGGRRERLAPIWVIVQDDGSSGWLTLDAAREDWPNAENIPDRTLFELLEISKSEVLAFAPKLALDATVPINYRKAQGMHARNIWNASMVDPSTGGTGEDTFAIRPFPLDWAIKQTLRPKRGIPVIV